MSEEPDAGVGHIPRTRKSLQTSRPWLATPAKLHAPKVFWAIRELRELTRTGEKCCEIGYAWLEEEGFAFHSRQLAQLADDFRVRSSTRARPDSTGLRRAPCRSRAASVSR